VGLLLVASFLAKGRGEGITLSTGHFDEKARYENMIITSLNNCPLCRGKEPCLMDCRQTEQKSWSECLNRCLGDNPLLLQTFTGKASSGHAIWEVWESSAVALCVPIFMYLSAKSSSDKAPSKASAAPPPSGGRKRAPPIGVGEVEVQDPEEPPPEKEPLPDRRVPYSLHVVSHLPHNKHLKEESNARKLIEKKIANSFANSEDIIKHVEVNLQVSENFHKKEKSVKSSKISGADEDAVPNYVQSTVAPFIFKVTVTLKNKRTVVLANPEKHAQATLGEGLDHMVDVIKRSLKQEKDRTIELKRRQKEDADESGPAFSEEDLEAMEADSLAAEEQAIADEEAERMYARMEAASTK